MYGCVKKYLPNIFALFTLQPLAELLFHSVLCALHHQSYWKDFHNSITQSIYMSTAASFSIAES